MSLTSDWFDKEGRKAEFPQIRLRNITKRMTIMITKILRNCPMLMSFFSCFSLISEEESSPLNSVLLLLEPEAEFIIPANTTMSKKTPQIGRKKNKA